MNRGAPSTLRLRYKRWGRRGWASGTLGCSKSPSSSRVIPIRAITRYDAGLLFEVKDTNNLIEIERLKCKTQRRGSGLDRVSHAPMGLGESPSDFDGERKVIASGTEWRPTNPMNVSFFAISIAHGQKPFSENSLRNTSTSVSLRERESGETKYSMTTGSGFKAANDFRSSSRHSRSSSRFVMRLNSLTLSSVRFGV